eukprot:5406089-Prymnesium_polylepis.2
MIDRATTYAHSHYRVSISKNHSHQACIRRLYLVEHHCHLTRILQPAEAWQRSGQSSAMAHSV